jgi:RimJ/RimL family protein N-acetyltransferase
VLRPWTETDLGCVEEACRDPRIRELTTVPARFSEDEGRAWISRQWGRLTAGDGLSLAVEDSRSGEAVGGAGLLFREQPGVVGLGYWLIERSRGRGLATSAVRLLSRWALKEAGLARVEALVEPENAASHRVLAKAGFTSEGCLRSRLGFDTRRADAVIYSLIPSDLDL